MDSQKGYSEMAETLSFAQGIVDLSKQDYAKTIESAEPVILELAIKVAERIIGSKLNENNETFLSIVKRTIKEARDNREVQLHVHPAQYPFILSQKEELAAIFPKNTDFYIYPDQIWRKIVVSLSRRMVELMQVSIVNCTNYERN